MQSDVGRTGDLHGAGKGLRRLGKVVLWSGLFFVFLLVALVACWFLRPDEDLLPEAQRLLAKKVTLPPEQNLHFALLGFGAGPEQNPYAVGRKIAEAYAAAEAASPPATANFRLEPFLGDHALKFERKRKRYCESSQADCLAAFRKADEEIRRETAALAVYVDRYHALRGYPHLAETMSRSLNAPLVPWAGLVNVSELVDAGIARSAVNPKERRAALKELAAEVVLWKRVATEADLLVTKMVGLSVLSRKYRLSSSLLREHPEMAREEEALMAAISEPLTLADTNMKRVLDNEFAFSVPLFRSAGDQEQVILGSDADGQWLGRAIYTLGGYKTNASINMHFVNLRKAGEIYSQPAAIAIGQEREMLRDRASFDMFSMSTLLYNPMGKILENVSANVWGEYAYRMYDLAAISRVLELQRCLALQKVPRNRVQAFLVSADAALQDPYTEKAMQWSDITAKISFDGRSAKFATETGYSLKIGFE